MSRANAASPSIPTASTSRWKNNASVRVPVGASTRMSANGYASIARWNFVGYDTLETPARIIALYTTWPDGDVKAGRCYLRAGRTAIVVLDRTPFYAESGGQVGDTGVLRGDHSTFDVSDTTHSGRQHLHQGAIKRGELRVGQTVTAVVENERRRLTALNHSATHLLHAALRKVLGGHVQQKGSLVSSDTAAFRLFAFVAGQRSRTA